MAIKAVKTAVAAALFAWQIGEERVRLLVREKVNLTVGILSLIVTTDEVHYYTTVLQPPIIAACL